ncbi:hypothetical protein B0H10DRAFT_1956497 [Mycena sp. CBHHK59/15]|nr:hypothetical protein B0H10DRAFT_1956497 [Mycena sp. CBHHK59/15]
MQTFSRTRLTKTRASAGGLLCSRRRVGAPRCRGRGGRGNDEEDVPVVPNPPRLNQLRAPRKWQPISIECLLAKIAKGSLRGKRGERMARHAQEEEQMYMQVMAELDAADNTPDDGEVEIDDSEVYGE